MNASRRITPTPAAMTAVHEGFRVAIPFAAASSPAPFATAGTLALPSAGGTALELRGRAGPGMATRFDVWNYGALSGFDASRCPFAPPAGVRRCGIHDDGDDTVYLAGRHAAGMTLILR